MAERHIITPESERQKNAPDRIYSYTKKYGETVSTLKPGFESEAEKYEGKYEIETPKEVTDICQEIYGLGGRALLVGGSVRDAVISAEIPGSNLEPKDYDLEVYGLSPEQLRLILETTFGSDKVDVTGKAFEVIKVKAEGWEEPLDVSIPRQESKVGEGHRGFAISGDPTMRIDEASLRRDLTINSLAYDPLSRTLYDAYGGVEDIKSRRIEVTDVRAFQEDPLRIMRVMQFGARFEFSATDRTTKLCRQMVERGDLDSLSRERVREEVEKLLTRGRRPSLGLEFARETGFLERYWPEAQALIGVPQEEGWHPEGDVWRHTLQTVDAAAEIANREIQEGRIPSEKQKYDLEGQRKSFYKTQFEDELVRLREEWIKNNRPDLYQAEKSAEVKSYGRAVRSSAKSQTSSKTKKQLDPKEIHARAVEFAKKQGRNGKIQRLENTFTKLTELGQITDQEVLKMDAQAEKSAEELAARITGRMEKEIRELEKLVLVLAALCHDFGKPGKTAKDGDGVYRSLGHEEAGIAPAQQFLERIFGNPKSSRVAEATRRVLPLVAEHLKPKLYWENETKRGLRQDKALRRLAQRLYEGSPNYPEGGGSGTYLLALVAEADQRGRNGQGNAFLTREGVAELEDWQSWFLERAKNLNVEQKPPEMLLTGMTFLQTIPGRTGGPWLGTVLNAVYADQLDGKVKSRQQAMELGTLYLDLFSKKVQTEAQETNQSERTIWDKVRKLEDPRNYLSPPKS